MPEPVVLDDSQSAVVEADVDSRLLVIAAAGQGKTEVVLSRLSSLAEQGIDILEDALVLSFSRGAVDAIRRRTERTNLDEVEARTFDSFAAKILLDAGELDDVRGGFEARIRRATEIIVSEDADVEHYDHVILDESQDLVGDRAEMVLALIRALSRDSGFTVLGDPLQGIYDFQLEEETSCSKRTSTSFLDGLVEEFGAERRYLTGYYRALTARAQAVVPVGDRIRNLIDEGADAEAAHVVLDEYRLNGGPGGPYRIHSLESVSGYLEDHDENETTAILATTNYEALCISEKLDTMNVQHVIRRRAQDSGIDRWVGSLMRHMESRKYTHREFDEAVSACRVSVPEAAWSLLKEVEHEFRDYQTLNVLSLNRRLRNVGPPVALAPADASGVVVSTVHRAKGLEFDHVIDVDPSPKSRAGERNWPNLRRRYVSASRPRENLFVLAKAPSPGGYANKVNGRWAEYMFRNGRKSYLARIEFTNDDIEVGSPCTPPDTDIDRGQEVLASENLLGENVELVLLADPSHEDDAQYWVRLSDGTVLGRTNSRFARDLRRQVLRPSSFNGAARWPKRLDGARVVSVETVAGDSDDTRSAGLGSSGFWLVPRLSGLIRAVWKSDGGKAEI